ncbi:MAG: nucleotide exchange factor GrpE [Planctomycetes bacterium]|nr:nucleotide exchange factor GrpE [Planctomycetota bacterium]MBL7008696.1 nucleotide exchange factor GrpE [Planctomycetota bacterium]
MSPRKKNKKADVAEPAADQPGAGGTPEAAAEGPPQETLEDWRDRALRAHAEMQNMRKRVDGEVEDRTRSRMEAMFFELIMLHDHLDLALASLPPGLEKDPATASFTVGVRAIHASFDDLLRRFGLEIIQPGAEQEFDPENHEAVQTVDREDLDEPRLELVRRGYRMGRRILRPAQVRLLRPAEITDPE